MTSLLEQSKKSFAFKKEDAKVDEKLYQDVLTGISKNVKVGPFYATSGIVLAYYLNASTNFLDKTIAPKIAKIYEHYLEHCVKPALPAEALADGKNVVCIGMETAGGMLVSQLCSMDSPVLNKWMDFIYMRKEKKVTGTCQQLEGPQIFTKRTKDSPKLYAIWIDDALSTGSSLADGMEILRRDYNIEVCACLYLVDRSKDRKNLSIEKNILAQEKFGKMLIRAIYDLDEVDSRINELKAENKL